MEAQMDTGKQQPMDTGTRLTGNSTWQEVADRLSEIEGHTVSHQAASDSGNRLLRRLKHKLIAIPEVKDWLIEQGIDTENI
jgi:hypothetical protein